MTSTISGTLSAASNKYHGEVKTDRYGRQIPKHAHGTVNLDEYTASSKRITAAILELFDRIVDKNLLLLLLA